MFTRRLIFIVSFLIFWAVVAASALVAGLSTSPGMDLVRKGVQWAGDRYLNGTVAIGRLDGNLWSSIRVTDLTMTLPDSLGGDEVLGAKNGELIFNLLNLFSEEPVLSCITVDGLSLFYRQGVGPRNWDSFGVILGFDHEPSGPSGPPSRIKIPEIQLTRGSFHYLDARVTSNVIDILAENITMGGRVKDSDHVGGLIQAESVAFLINGLQDSVRHLEAEFRRKGDRLILPHVVFRSASGPELELSITGELSSLKTRAVAFDISGQGDVGAIGRLIGTSGILQGPFTLSGSMQNSMDRPVIAARLSSDEMLTEIGYISNAVLDLGFEGRELDFSHFEGDTESGRISGKALLDVSGDRHRYSFRLAPSTLTLKSLPPLLVGDSVPIGGSALTELELQGTGWVDPELSGWLNIAGDRLWMDGRPIEDFSARLKYDRGALKLDAQSSAGALSAEGGLSLNGSIDLRADLFFPDAGRVGAIFGEPSADGLGEFSVVLNGYVGRPSVWFDGLISDLGYAGVPLGTLMVTGSIDADQVGRVDAYLDTTKVQVSLEADLSGDRDVSGRIDMVDLSFRDFVDTRSDLDIDARLDLVGSIEGSLSSPVIHGNGLLRDLTMRGENLGNTSVALTLEDRDLSFTLVKPDFSVISDGLIRLEDSYPFDVRLDVKRANVSPLLSILAKRKIDRRTGRFTGKLQAVGFAEFPDLSTITVALDSLIMKMDDQEIYFAAPSTVRLDRQMVTIDQLELTGDLGHVMLNGIASLKPGGLLDVEAQFEGVQVDLLSPFLLPKGNVSGSADGFFSLTGSPESPAIHGLFSTADVQYSDGDRINDLGTVSLSLNYEDRELRFPALSLDTPLGSASATLSYPIDLSWGGPAKDTGDEEFSVNLDMNHLAIAPLRNFLPAIPADLDGTVNGNIEVRGPTARPEDMAGTIAIDSLRLFGLQNELVNREPLRVKFNAGYADLDPVTISLSRLSQTSEDLGSIAAVGRFAFQTESGVAEVSDLTINSRNVSLEALQALMGQDLAVSGAMDGQLEISGTGSTKSWDARVKLDRLTYNEAAVDSIETRVVYEYGDLIVHDFQTWFKDRTLVAYGTIPFSFQRSDGLADIENMAITVEGDDLDLSFLSGIVYDVERVKGRADVQLTVGGTPSSAKSVGSILIKDVEIKSRELNPPLRTASMELVVDGDKVTLNPVEMKAGNGSIYGFSSLLFENFSISNYDAHITLNKADVELIGSAKLVANGSLSLIGDRLGGQLSGTSLSASGIVTHPLNLGSIILGTGDVIRPAAAPDPFLEGIALDVEIDIPRLRIRNAMADLEIEGGVALGGTAQNPVITGNAATLDNGSIVYLDTRFDVETGRLEFLNRTPLESFTSLVDYPLVQTNPEVTMQATATGVRDIYGGEYDVDLSLTGRAMQPNLELTANPSQEVSVGLRDQNTLFGPQVVSLLTFGLPGMKADTETFTGIGNRALLMATGNQAEKLLKLDEVRIEGDLLSNNTETGSPAQITVSKWINRRTRVTYTRLFDSSEYQLRVGYQLSNFLFIETFTDQIGERPQNGLDLKLKFRFR